MAQTVQQTLADPKFYGLPPAEQQKVLATLDPNYARLPLAERTKVLQMGQQRLNANPSAPPEGPPVGPPGQDGQSLPFVRYNKAGFPIYQGTPASAGRYTSDQPAPPPVDWRTPLTEIQPHQFNDFVVPHNATDLGGDYAKWWREVGKGWGNVGGAFLGVPLHPLYTAQQIVRQMADLPQAMTDLANQGIEQPLETAEGSLGQAAAFDAATELAPKILGGARSVVEGGIRRLAGSGPGVASKLARAAAEDNRVIDINNFNKMAEAQQKWQEAQDKANYAHRANLLELKQSYEQSVRDATNKARTGTAEDRAGYQSNLLKAKQKYDQDVRDATVKFVTDRAEAQRVNAEAQRQYNQNIGKAVQQNRDATEAQTAKSAQANRLQVAGSQLIYGLRQLDKALRDHADTMFNAVREKVGSKSRPGTDLAQATRTALSKITGTSVIPTVFRDILSKYPESEPEVLDYHGTKVPRGTRLYDDLIQYDEFKAPPVTFVDLQGYYSETGAELSKGTLPGDVYQATKQLHNAIGDMMQEMADSAGAGKEFWDSRVFYRNYMDVFHEPTGPSGSGSPVAQALLAKDPLTAVDKFAGDAGDRGIATLRRYNDRLATLAQDARRIAQAKVSVPERASIADIKPPKTTPVPTGSNLPLPPVMEPVPIPRASNLNLPPVLPEREVIPFRQPKLAPRRVISAGDLQRANEAAVRARAAGLAGHLFWWTGVWPAFRMLSELSRGAEVSLKPLALMPAAGAAGMATEELMSQPAVMDFLTRATRQQVAQIPPDIRGAIPEIVTMAKKRGVQVSPILVAYAATIQQNRGQNQSSPQPTQLTAPNGAGQ